MNSPLAKHVLLSVTFLAFLFGLSLAGSSAVRAQSPGPTMLVLDGSGSMWGQINGTAKVEIARDVIGDVVGNLPNDSQLGLVAYGHRREGDCADIQTMVTPGPLEKASFLVAVNSVTPLGKTPLTDAVRTAARGLSAAPGGTVILVTDGLETCSGDPCALAAELEAADVSFTIHVVGFGLGEGEGAALRCMADETGGLFLAASDSASLSTAIETATGEVTTEVGDKAELFGVIESGGSQIEDNISWSIYDAEDTLLTAGTRPTFNTRLEPGIYSLVAVHGDVEIVTNIELTGALGQRIEIPFGSGWIALSAVLAQGGEPLDRGVYWIMYKAKPDGSRGDHAAREARAAYEFKLAPGRYIGVIETGDTEREFRSVVAAGEHNAQVINLDAGKISVHGLDPDGQDLSGSVSWKVYPADDASARAVATEAARKTTFLLPAGNYRITVKTGDLEAEQIVELLAGQMQDIEFHPR